MSKYECCGDNHRGYIIDTTKIPNYKSRETFEKEALQKIDCSNEDKKDDALTMAYLKWQDYLGDYKLDLQEVRDTLNKQDKQIQEFISYFESQNKEKNELEFKLHTLTKWYTCRDCAFSEKELKYLRSLEE